MIEIKIDADKIRIALADLQHKTSNLSPVLKAIGEILIESTRQRFSSGTGPDGVKWQDHYKPIRQYDRKQRA